MQPAQDFTRQQEQENPTLRREQRLAETTIDKAELVESKGNIVVLMTFPPLTRSARRYCMMNNL